LIVFSRDELKQHEMRIGGYDHHVLRYFIGDVREKDRLKRAMADVDIVIHAAALKQVPICEYNPFEAVKTNIIGSQKSLIRLLIVALKGHRVGTDKAVTLSTCMVQRSFVQKAPLYSGVMFIPKQPTRFSCVRYGNVIRSERVILFLDTSRPGNCHNGPRMTFWIT
jgi:FlaA1/EpsC-like NDP-sugar epimerase